MRARVALLAAVALLPACGAPPPAAAPAPGVATAPAGAFESGAWGTFRSGRFELSIALPDGAAWRIDDHRTRWLDARNAPTASRLRARAWREDHLVTRAACLATARGWEPMLPELDPEHLLDDRVDRMPGTDARIAVQAAIAPIEPGDPVLRGAVLAVAADVKRCLVVAYETEATGEARERLVGARLAVIADRTMKSLAFAAPLVGPRAPAR